MVDDDGVYIFASIHDFKTNISKYIRVLERRQRKAVIVKRYNKVVGVFLTSGGAQGDDAPPDQSEGQSEGQSKAQPNSPFEDKAGSCF